MLKTPLSLTFDGRIHDREGKMVSTAALSPYTVDESQVLLAEVVRRVNSHDDLVQALMFAAHLLRQEAFATPGMAQFLESLKRTLALARGEEMAP